MGRPKFAAFDQGQVPTIACFIDPSCRTPLGSTLPNLVKALQAYVDTYFAPIWGTPCKLVQSTGFLKGAWAIVFLETADEPGALAYHDLTPDGLPLSKVFVGTTVKAKESVSVATSHELAEMLVDPAINMMCTGPDETAMYAYETADPVEALSFKVNGLAMSDFVYPSYFEGFRKAKSVKFDYLGKVAKPFQILKGGYQIVFRDGEWTQVFGSKSKAKAFAKEDRRGHRSEQRPARGNLKRSGKLRAAGGDFGGGDVQDGGTWS